LGRKHKGVGHNGRTKTKLKNCNQNLPFELVDTFEPGLHSGMVRCSPAT